MPKPVREVVRDPRRSNAPICTAIRASGKPCGYIAVRGTTKCQVHGGKSLSGIAHPNYKTGRYAKSLPAQLAARTAEALSNPRLLSMSDNIAVAEAHLAQLFARLPTGESGAAWRQLRATFAAMVLARQQDDWDTVNTHFATLGTLIQQGAAEAATWDEIRQWKETHRKLVETEMKTLQGMQQMITVQQHMLMVNAQTDAVVRAIEAHADTQTGRKILMDIQREFERLATLEEKR